MSVSFDVWKKKSDSCVSLESFGCEFSFFAKYTIACCCNPNDMIAKMTRIAPLNQIRNNNPSLCLEVFLVIFVYFFKFNLFMKSKFIRNLTQQENIISRIDNLLIELYNYNCYYYNNFLDDNIYSFISCCTDKAGNGEFNVLWY